MKAPNTTIKLMLKWAGALAILGGICYPVIIYPMMNPKKYRDIQEITRKDIDRTKIQPGNMRIWTDPFAPK